MIIPSKGQLAHEPVFKVKQAVQGKKKSGICLGTVDFGKPVSFTGVYETFSFAFFRFRDTNIVKYYINGQEQGAIKFNPKETSTKVFGFRYHNKVKIELKEADEELQCTMSIYNHRVDPEFKRPKNIETFIILNQLEWSLLKRGYSKYNIGEPWNYDE